MPLATGEHGLDVGHHRLQILAFVQEHTIPIGHLFLPVLLPFRQSKLLEIAMSANDEHGRSRLEAHTTLDANDGIAHVAVASDSESCTDFLDLLDGFYFVVELLAVHRAQFSLLETELEEFRTFCRGVLQVGTLRQALLRIEYLAATNACPPEADIVAVFELCEVGKVAIPVEIVHLLLSGEVAIARQSDDFHARAHHEERHVEADLVVAGTRRAVGYGRSPYFASVPGDGECLENALARHRNRVAIVAQNVAEDHILQRLLVVFLRHVQGDILLCAQLVGVLFVGLELLRAESSRVGTGSIDFVTFLLRQIHHRVAGVKSATEGDNNFLHIVLKNESLYSEFVISLFCDLFFRLRLSCFLVQKKDFRKASAYSIPRSTSVRITSLMTSSDVGSPLCFSGSHNIPVQTQNFLFLASRISWLMQP